MSTSPPASARRKTPTKSIETSSTPRRVDPRQARAEGPGPATSAHHDHLGEAADVGLDAEVRGARVPLGMEDIHAVGVGRGNTEVGGLRVEVERGSERRMQPAEIERQLVVDEDPKV